MSYARLICPRCGGETHEIEDLGEYDEDISYMSCVCGNCGLKFDGWFERWEDEEGNPWTGEDE
jgi:hypothetical protein